MDRPRLVRELVFFLGGALASPVLAQSVELTRPLARGNLHRGTVELSHDGRWVVFAGHYGFGSSINSLYGVVSDGSAEPFLLYGEGDLPGFAREFDPGTVTFVHLTPNSRWALFTVAERGSIYSAYLGAERHLLPTPRHQPLPLSGAGRYEP